MNDRRSSRYEFSSVQRSIGIEYTDDNLAQRPIVRWTVFIVRFRLMKKRKKKQNPLIYIRTGVRIRSIAGYVHSRARASSNVIFLSSRIFCIICPLATFAYMLHTYIHIHIHIHIYIHPYNIRTHTHAFVHTNRHIKRPFSRCTRDIKSSNKKKETREKSEKKKEKKKKKRKRETNERRVFVSHIRECSLFHLHFSPFYWLTYAFSRISPPPPSPHENFKTY